ncbi:leucine-rich repeat-containing protein 33 precursor, putative [Entamoeba invadens IP1]|uniref:leucine-rich repeat-containing protein 33 precursor, putative n=1 Tax=Entamoeba invadens IP1 TaxID=370355 RepID=UPI0002C3CF29|nr:leucine-rich repeat-containing protein 33 precursor, putative [Entamoeba invadens IP1]ELP85095.1 leucine-rich repeat-containing protein 33 precursor, putative [Entamoeba invadens IP1]|eukprot:XP_004184441.1 leucine-rich repeat-containing protein 33 precursor, putative [Entamoeba invadens IP1]
MSVFNANNKHLTVFPAEILGQQYCRLKDVSLDDNNITIIPYEICVLTELTHLSMKNNKLEKLPNELCTLNLYLLNVMENCLTSLPKTIENFTLLTELNISSNEITALPETIVSLSNLVRLNANSNKLRNIPERFHELTNLTYVNLSQNNFNVIPTSLFENDSLLEINLAFNDIVDIPMNITNLTKLTKLDLNNNELHTLPPHLFTLPELEILHLEGNPIDDMTFGLDVVDQFKINEITLSFQKTFSLAQPLEPVTPLKVIKARNSFIKELPPSLKEFKGLEVVDLAYNEITEIVNFPKRIVTANFNFNNISVCDVGEGCGLRQFYAKHNKLTEFPNSIAGCSQLEECDLSCNLITTFPAKLCSLQLRFLDVSFNKLSSLDIAICKLNKLKVLNVSFNNLSSVPSFISSLISLEQLYLTGNKLKELPNELSSLSNLSVLHLGDNQFATVPEIVLNFPKISRLYISGNPIYSLNSVIGMNQINTLDFTNCFVSSCEGICGMKFLKQLLLTNNYISKLPTFKDCVSLVYVDLGFNSLIEIPYFTECHELQYIDVSFNDLYEDRSVENAIRREDGCLRIHQFPFLNRFADSLKFRPVPTRLSTAQTCCGEEMRNSILCIPNFAGPDHFLFGISEGHNGNLTAFKFNQRFPTVFYDTLKKDVTIEYALKEAFGVVQYQFLDYNVRDGTCVTVVFVTPTKIYTAQCGNSIPVYFTNNTVTDLCDYQKAAEKSEEKRIKRECGIVDEDGTVYGFEFSRSIGDIPEKGKVSYVPQISITERVSNEEYLVLASEAMWKNVCKTDIQQLLHGKRYVFRTGEIACLLKDIASVSNLKEPCGDVSIVLCRF